MMHVVVHSPHISTTINLVNEYNSHRCSFDRDGGVMVYLPRFNMITPISPSGQTQLET